MHEENKNIKDKYYEDILFMINKIEEIHPCPYFNTTQDEIAKMLLEFKNSDNINTEAQYQYFAHKIIQKFNDPHTSINIPLSEIPLQFRIIAGKIFIVNASDEYKHLIGQELLSINNVNINTVIAEAKDIVSATMPTWVDFETQRNLSNLNYLSMLPSMKESESYSFQTKNDNVNFNLNQEFDYTGLNEPNYGYTIDTENNVITISYKKCKEEPGKPIIPFVIEIKKIAEQYGIDDFIVDIRENYGGNTNVTWPIIKVLENKNITVLVDSGVFSSGSLALYDLKYLGAKVVGSHIGTTWNNFGECKKLETPNLNLEFFVSQKYYFLNDENKLTVLQGQENFNSFFSNPENQRFLIPQVFEPDIYIDYQTDDIFGNNMKQVALEQINVSHNTK